MLLTNRNAHLGKLVECSIKDVELKEVSCILNFLAIKILLCRIFLFDKFQKMT
jgi:hypothetical protein